MPRSQDGAERNAIEVLLDDHKRVQKLFKDFEKVDRDDAESLRELVETTCMELQIHSMLEEELFYPAVRAEFDTGEMNDRLNRAEVQHETADELIAKLQELSPEDPMYFAYFSVLGDYVRHHLREEEKELFPATSKATGIDLGQLGEDMRRRREELFAEIESSDGEEEDSEDDLEDSMDGADIGDTAVEDEGLEDEQESIDPRRTRH